MEKEEESLERLEKGRCKGGYGNPRPKGSMARMAQGPKGKAKDNNNAVGEEPQALGEVEYVGWGGVIGNIECIDTDEKNWEPFEKQEIILGNIDEVGGLEPTWRKKLGDSSKLKMAMDSGCITTIVPPETIPGMKVVETKNTGKNYRVANGNLVPNEGATRLTGKRSMVTAWRLQPRSSKSPSHWHLRMRSWMQTMG